MGKTPAHLDDFMSNEADNDEEVYFGSEHNSSEANHSGEKIHQDKVQTYQMDDKVDEESNKTDIIEDGTMNVFGFADDLNLDDRQIMKNASDNQIYNLVERPKYLMQFEQKDAEREFLFVISKQ